ncbi:MAG: molybdenum cofactor guanylyltransferase [Pseudomonadota bacterium]
MHVQSVPYNLGGHLVAPRTAPVSFLTGVVLAGGKSSRMGQDKAALMMGQPLPSGESGPALAFRMADVLGLALHADNPKAEIWISCQSDRHIPPSHAHLGRVHDTIQDAGPLAGITAALEAAKGPIFVLACDMPLMQSQTVQLLIDARQAALQDGTRQHPLLVTAFQGHGKSLATTPNFEPLVAIYEYSALPLLQQALQKKHFSLRRIVDQEALCVVPYGQNHEESFFNMNNPDDLYTATQLLLRHTWRHKA